MATGIPAYFTGKVAVTSGSDTITLSGGSWTGNAHQGDPIRLPDGKVYAVKAEPANGTTLTILPNYEGATIAAIDATEGNYFLIRRSDLYGAAAEQSFRAAAMLDALVAVFRDTGVPSPILGGVGSVYWRTEGNSITEIYVKDETGWGTPISMEVSPELAALRDDVNADAAAAAASATAAAASATAAAGSVTSAETQATAAATSATNAATSSTAANTSKNAAATSATNAASSATAAASSATAASGSASAAAASATAAGGSATAASTSAATATTKATAAAASATAAAASATSAATALARGLTATSATSRTIGAGTHTLTTQTNLAFIAGQRLRMVSAGSPANYMEGQVASYSGTTLVLTVPDEGVYGEGTFADWNIAITGEPGTFAALGSIVSFAGKDVIVEDNNFTIQNGAAPTKQAIFDASAITAGQTRSYGLPNASGSLLLDDGVKRFKSVVVRVMTTSGLYTPTPGMAECIIRATAGGGGGGGVYVGAAAAMALAAGGGSGGSTALGKFTAAQIGENKYVTVGAGGAGGAGNNPGADGSTSGVGTAALDYSLLQAPGGMGGVKATRANAGGAVGAGGVGVTAVTGTEKVYSEAGGYGLAVYNATVASGVAQGGKGGGSFFGGGGRSQTTIGSSIAGAAGQAYGSGGSGAAISSATNAAAATGGAGAAGYVEIVEFIG